MLSEPDIAVAPTRDQDGDQKKIEQVEKDLATVQAANAVAFRKSGGGKAKPARVTRSKAQVKPSGSAAAPKTTQSASTGGSTQPKAKPKTRNGHLAGSRHPVTGVPFDENGFPDFSNYLYKPKRGQKNDVLIKPTGDKIKDAKAANEAAGFKSTPEGYTWHHHQDTGRMQLVKSDVHRKTGHTGGFSLWEVPQQ